MPTPTKYTYSIAGDFPNDLVATDRLSNEIGTSSITKALDYVATSGDVCDVWFKDVISSSEETTLDGIVAAHTGVPLPQNTALPVYLKTASGTSAPSTSEGKPIFLPNIFPGNVTLYITGQGDGSTTRGDGTVFNASRSTSGETDVEWSMIDWYYIAGGGMTFLAGLAGDYISLMVYAPATSITASGNNTGNCNRTEVVANSGLYIITPANGNGAYTVDLSTAVIVPAFAQEDDAGTGYWDWSAPDTGRGTISASTPGVGKYNLYTFAIDLARFGNRIPLLGAGMIDLTLSAIKPKKILPHWKMKATLHNDGGLNVLQAAWWITAARIKTLD